MRTLRRDLREGIKKQAVVNKVREGRFKSNVYLVGGAVRETALERSPKDYDFVIDREEDLREFESVLHAGAFILGKKPLQTHRIVVKDLSVDINLFAGPIEDDLLRRDFTINAIAYDMREDRLVDPLDGLKDITDRVIRCPRPQALLDDPLRMLKAIRHFATLRDFMLHEDLIAGIRQLKHLILHVSPERIKNELDQIVVSSQAFEGIKAMEETGLLFELFPGLRALKDMDKEKGFVLETYGHTIDGFKYLKRYGDIYGLDEKAMRDAAYALLFHDLGKAHTFSYDEEKDMVHFFYHERYSRDAATAIMERLRFSTHEIRAIIALIESHMRIFLISGSDCTERAVRRLVYKMGDLSPLLIVHTLCDMYGSSGGGENLSTVRVEGRCRDVLHMYYEWKREPLPRLVNGDDLIALGFQPGPAVGMILADIREKQIAGEIKEKAEALKYAESFLHRPE